MARLRSYECCDRFARSDFVGYTYKVDAIHKTREVIDMCGTCGCRGKKKAKKKKK
jgi:hypothetical protein